MKRKLAILLCAVLVLVGTVVGSSSIVNASGNYISPELTLTTVEDIDVYNDYKINKLTIDNSLTNNQDGDQVYKITLEKDGFVSLLLTARDITKIVTRSGKSKEEVPTLTSTIYRDLGLLYGVTNPITAKGNTKGESPEKVALDQGTYYIVVHSDVYKNNDITTYVKGTAELIVYYQRVNSNEIHRPSTFGKENKISIDSEFVGLLTATNPKDYYKFELTNKALVKFNIMYGSTKNTKFILYSAEREALVTKDILGNSVWYNVEKYLEPGTYYCSLETAPKDIYGGQTNFLITQTVYPLKLTQINTTKNSYVSVATIDAPMEIRCVKGKLNNSELASSKWKNSKVITEDLKFGVNKTGFYTVRVTDEYGNMFMQSIKVTTCDKLAPTRPTITSYKAGSYVVSGKAEINSTVIVTVGKKSYKCTANSYGNYECDLNSKLAKGNEVIVTAQDISENVSNKARVTVK